MNIEAILSAVATTLGNMGAGFGKMGPMFSFAYIPPAGKMDRQAGNRDGTGAAGAGVLEEMIPENASKFLEITMPYALWIDPMRSNPEARTKEPRIIRSYVEKQGTPEEKDDYMQMNLLEFV